MDMPICYLRVRVPKVTLPSMRSSRSIPVLGIGLLFGLDDLLDDFDLMPAAMTASVMHLMSSKVHLAFMAS